MHACDGRTDGRTDRQTEIILLAIPRLHYMQRGKNERRNLCRLLAKAHHILSVYRGLLLVYTSVFCLSVARFLQKILALIYVVLKLPEIESFGLPHVLWEGNSRFTSVSNATG